MESLLERLDNIKPNPNTVSDDIDFWKDASEFLKTQLPSDYEDNLNKYILEKGYNNNELRLFNSIIKEVIGLSGNVVLIKNIK